MVSPEESYRNFFIGFLSGMRLYTSNIGELGKIEEFEKCINFTKASHELNEIAHNLLSLFVDPSYYIKKLYINI